MHVTNPQMRWAYCIYIHENSIMKPLKLFLKWRWSQASVAHTCNPSYLGAEVRRIEVLGQLGQIVSKTPAQKKKNTKKG
jgi:hypothetical protein